MNYIIKKNPTNSFKFRADKKNFIIFIKRKFNEK